MSVTVHMRPPTLDGHNFLVRAPFGVLLDSMERYWSLESDHMLFNVQLVLTTVLKKLILQQVC